MESKLFLRLSIPAILFATVLSIAPAQKPNRFEDAQARSRDAGRIITLLAVLPDGDLPKELIDKARAIGVFPIVKQEALAFTKVSQGYGVISSRLEAGWSMPAFYQFSGGGYGNPFKTDNAHSLILLFMTKDAVSWFEKGGVPLKNEKKAVAGPVGNLTDEQRKELEKVQILAYAFFNGNLNGKSFGNSFWKSFLLNPDNKINTPLYGIKGREVLAGMKPNNTDSLPEAIPMFRDALEKYYSARKD